jgi:predicted DCC family thiol-disulfide oxidoreductase YuxK
MTLMYDADCGFCRRAVRWGRPMLRAVEVRPLGSVDLPAVGVDPIRAEHEIPFQARDGSVSYGADAVAAAIAAGPAPWHWAGRAMASPPVIRLARSVYRWVERHR